MTISPSSGLLESMGFHLLSEPDSISARFHCLHVYKIQGFTLDGVTLHPQSGVIDNRSFQLAVGTSVNAICRLLVNDDLVENEQEWQTQAKCIPPYLVVHFGPSEDHVFAGTRGDVDGPIIQTYDGFRVARTEMDAWGAAVLPSLLTGFVSGFSAQVQRVKISTIHRVFYGLTNDGRTLSDTRLTGSGHAYGSIHLDSEQISTNLAEAINIAGRIKRKVARFFHLAMQEDDPLKRFLFYFLAVEIQTHETFKSMGLPRDSLLGSPPERATASAQFLVEPPRESWKSVQDRFIWCVLSEWHHLTDADVEVFRRLKGVRDKIAHGSLSEPPAEAVIDVEKLAARLQLSRGDEASAS